VVTRWSAVEALCGKCEGPVRLTFEGNMPGRVSAGGPVAGCQTDKLLGVVLAMWDGAGQAHYVRLHHGARDGELDAVTRKLPEDRD